MGKSNWKGCGVDRIASRGRKPAFTIQQKMDILREKARGATVTELSRKYRVSRRTINRVLKPETGYSKKPISSHIEDIEQTKIDTIDERMKLIKAIKAIHLADIMQKAQKQQQSGQPIQLTEEELWRFDKGVVLINSLCGGVDATRMIDATIYNIDARHQEVHITFDKEGFTRLLLNEIVYPVLKQELPIAVAQPVVAAMGERYRAKLDVLERFGDDEEESG